MKCSAYDHDELAATKDGCPYCGSATEQFFDEIAESITKKWASFDRAPQRVDIKARFRLAVASAVTLELITATENEMRGTGAKW